MYGWSFRQRLWNEPVCNLATSLMVLGRSGTATEILLDTPGFISREGCSFIRKGLVSGVDVYAAT